MGRTEWEELGLTMEGHRITKMDTDMISDELREKIYREVWTSYVEEDIIARCEDIGVDLKEGQAWTCAELFVQGKYDCTLSYWDNIDNLIEQFRKGL